MSASEIEAQFDDIEVVTFRGMARVAASNITDDNSATGDLHRFEQLELIDYDDIVDRNESLHLLTAYHELTAMLNGGEDATPSTQYGVMLAMAEVQAAPSQSGVSRAPTGGGSAGNLNQVSGSPEGNSTTEDSIDFVGAPLMAMTGQNFSDSASGVGGGSPEGDDEWQGSTFPAEFGRFHPRDELFLNGEMHFWNTDVAGGFMQVTGQHVYGVIAE